MYSAYVLTRESKDMLMELFPPMHPDVVAHHITYSFPAKNLPPDISTAKVVGHAFNDDVEALVVEIDGDYTRPDGGVFHITWSLDRDAGAKPVHSNNLIMENGWNKVKPVSIAVMPDLL